jgi:hypothetical protein
MALSTRNSVLAIVREVTEGTPVSPSAGTDYIALQEGFDVEPAFTELENAELTGSVGRAKTIVGAEEPTASISHYIRHSGVENTAPNFSDLIEAFMGATASKGTERDTIAASTVSVIKVNVGEGAEYQRGMAVLLKDATNGYRIRNVLSISGDDLTLAQHLPTGTAPAAGVNLGRPILYKPAENPVTLSGWLYRGNNAAGAVELLAGCRVTDMSIDASANELINGSFTLSGTSYYFDPIEITASTDTIDFNDGGVKVATVTAKVYKDPYDLASALQTAMDAASADTITVTYSDTTGKFTIASSGATLELLWNTGANTAQTIGTKLGFSVAADDTGALTYTSDNAVSKASPYTPSFDSANPLVAKNNEVLLSSVASEATCFKASSVTINGTNTKTDIESLCAESGKDGSVISQREISIDIVATLQDHQAQEFNDFRQGTKVMFTYNCGEKSGGNWVAGKCVNFHTPTATISAFKLSDDNGIVTLEMTLRCYVDSGLGEFFINFV